MKIVWHTLASFFLATAFIVTGAMAAWPLSKEVAPDVPPQILEKLLQDAKVYMGGRGTKEVLLLADPYCENSRKTYRQLLEHLEQIGTLRILWVSAFPTKGSEVVAAAAMKMQSSGRGEAALKTVFDMDIPPSTEIDKARKNAQILVNEKFRSDLGELDLQRLQPELDQVRKNTALAEEIDYTGTPHFLMDNRVLHGHSGPAIRIMLQQ
jgi:hypothetical protein